MKEANLEKQQIQEDPAKEAGERLAVARREVTPYFDDQGRFLGFVDQYGQLVPRSSIIVRTLAF